MEAFSTHVQRIFLSETIIRKDSKKALESIGRIESGVEKIKGMLDEVSGIDHAAAVFLVSLMDVDTREQWRMSRVDTDQLPSLESVATYYRQKVKTWDEAVNAQQGKRDLERRPKVEDRFEARRDSFKKKKLECYRCHQNHILAICPIFKNEPEEKQRRLLERFGLCETCFGRHSTSACLRKRQ